MRDLLALVGLAGTKQRVQGFSRGMKQRLGIAQALLGNPKLLICDEPTSALDPAGRKEILELLYSLKGHATVLFSTHILSDVERICDECAILHKGRLVKQGKIQKLKDADGTQGFLIEFLRAEDVEKFMGIMSGGERIDMLTLAYGGTKNTFAPEIMMAMELLVKEGITVCRIERRERTLEEMFCDVLSSSESEGK